MNLDRRPMDHAGCRIPTILEDDKEERHGQQSIAVQATTSVPYMVSATGIMVTNRSVLHCVLLIHVSGKSMEVDCVLGWFWSPRVVSGKAGDLTSRQGCPWRRIVGLDSCPFLGLLTLRFSLQNRPQATIIDTSPCSIPQSVRGSQRGE